MAQNMPQPNNHDGEYSLIAEGIYRVRTTAGVLIAALASVAFIFILFLSNPMGRISSDHIVMSFAILITFLTFVFLSIMDLKVRQKGNIDVPNLIIKIVASLILGVASNYLFYLLMQQGR